jgi:hypothetical protein
MVPGSVLQDDSGYAATKLHRVCVAGARYNHKGHRAAQPPQPAGRRYRPKRVLLPG